LRSFEELLDEFKERNFNSFHENDVRNLIRDERTTKERDGAIVSDRTVPYQHTILVTKRELP
jgi:hypothetical protein